MSEFCRPVLSTRKLSWELSGGHSGRGLPVTVTRVTFSLFLCLITYFIHRRFVFCVCFCECYFSYFYFFLHAAFNSFILIIFSLLCSLITNNIVSCFILLLSYNFTINYNFRSLLLHLLLLLLVFCFMFNLGTITTVFWIRLIMVVFTFTCCCC